MMVRIDRVYTRTGDDGETSMGDGSRVRKTDDRIAAMGSVDELNCAIGTALTLSMPPHVSRLLRDLQNELFDLGADLCCPVPVDGSADESDSRLRMTADNVTRLESEIDRFAAELTPLTSFILPGGTPAAAAVHTARVLCRRAERDALAASAVKPLNPEVIRYLNRLSDLLFVLARACNENGRDDVLWVPGKERSP